MITTPEQMREAAIVRIDALINAANKAGLDDRKEGLRDAHHAIRAIPIAPQPATDWTTCAADMMRVWDTWFGGSADSDHAAADRLAIASAFAAQAFEHAASSGITADGAPDALLRAFFLALIDKLHPDLDYLRADPASGEKARAKRGAIAPPVVAAPQPMAVAVNPLVWDDEVDIGYSSKEPSLRTILAAYYLPWFSIEKSQELTDKYIAALTIHPADPLSDPRVVALVEALRCYEDQLCEGFCADMPDKSLTSSAMENDCGGCKARAAIRAIGGEA